MSTRLREQWDRDSALAGTVVWVGLAALAGRGRAPLGVIELLFLFAPLVIVPLGLSLGDVIVPWRFRALDDAARVLQPLAALLAVASFWITPGPRAAALAAAWAVVCAALAADGMLTLISAGNLSITARAAAVARLDLAIAAAWLLISRAGIHPLGFQEPIVLLTAVHFHFTGFAGATLAGAVAAFSRRMKPHNRPGDVVVALVVLLPFLLAAGFVFSPTLKLIAAAALSLAMTCLAIWQFAVARRTSAWTSRGFLCLSSLCVLAGMTLAGIYALGDWMGEPWLTIPRMASTHGLLNGLGFALLGILGWLVEFRGVSSLRVSKEIADRDGQRFPASSVGHSLPVAFFSDYEPPHLRRACGKN